MNFLKNIKIDRRIIYLLLALSIIIPLINPLSIPIVPDKLVIDTFDVINGLPDGGKVIISFDYAAGAGAELDPQAAALLQHFMSKGMKTIAVATDDQGTLMAQPHLEQLMKGGYEYGVDFINLGFIPGKESGLAAFAENIPKVKPQDIYGTSIESFEMMKDVKSLNDVDAFVSINYGSVTGVSPEHVVRQISAMYKVPVIMPVSTVIAPGTLPYYEAGQLQGFMVGLKGAADYEMLLGKPGTAVSAMDAQSLAHLLMIAFIILGNVIYLLNKKNKKQTT